MNTGPCNLKAVIFDVGGVVVRSPLLAIADYEREIGLPNNYINCSLTARGRDGAWQQFERGEIDLHAFYEAFGRQLSDIGHGNAAYQAYCTRKHLDCPKLPEFAIVNGRELFGRMMRLSATWDDVVVNAIRTIRAAGGHRVIALTNNYAASEQNLDPEELAFLGWTEGATPPTLKALFDDFVDSSTTGMRKPEPAFYLLACERNNIRPEEAVFLDDLGLNLKIAKQLGMKTIHVPIGGSLESIKQLQELLGFNLLDTSQTHDGRSKL